MSTETSQPFFLDTNILVYAYGNQDKTKEAVSKGLLATALKTDEGFISSQVVQEFCNVSARRFAKPIIQTDINDLLDEVLLIMWRHLPSLDFYKRTLVLCSRFSFSFYDALIVQAALDLDCSTLYSEDLQDGQKFGSLKIVNPFK